MDTPVTLFNVEETVHIKWMVCLKLGIFRHDIGH